MTKGMTHTSARVMPVQAAPATPARFSGYDAHAGLRGITGHCHTHVTCGGPSSTRGVRHG